MSSSGSNEGESAALPHPDEERIRELKAFDDTKAGVKGLVDAGITEVPRIFINPHQHDYQVAPSSTQVKFPIIDLRDICTDPEQRRKVVEEVRAASGSWGFFNVVNHGIPESMLQEMLNGIKKFFEMDDESKKAWYTRDVSKKMVYNSNFDLYSSSAANWRDTMVAFMAPHPPEPEELPDICRDILMKFCKHVMQVGRVLLELFSEALELESNHLFDMDLGKGLATLSHYYPSCPQPEQTLGTTKHTDKNFFTVLLQDEIGGLQVLHQNQWVDVPPTPGALVINIGEFLQLVTNDKFKSVEHRVVANSRGPRVSIACFFTTHYADNPMHYGPIKEILSEDSPAKYKDITTREYFQHYTAKGPYAISVLEHLKI